MPQHVVKRGLDLPISGAATGAPVTLPEPATVAYAPQEFAGIIPRLEAKEGARVRIGDPVFHSKAYPQMKFLSPVAGVVKEVRRGHRRVITDIVIERDGTDSVAFPTWDLGRLTGISREEARDGLLAGGLWPVLRTRPLSNVAKPDHTPQSILVSATETGPLQPGPDVMLDAGDKEFLQAGIYVLKALTDGPVFLTAMGNHPALDGIKGADRHDFKGPHPAGDAPVQVNLIDPPRGQNEVWYAKAWDVVLIGKLFMQGRFPNERVYAGVGAGVKGPRFVKTLLGAPARDIVGETTGESARWIRGSVLTGTAISPERFGGFYTNAIHVLPDTVQREVFGWTMPQLGLFSFHKAYLSGFFKPSRTYDLRPGLWGGHRGMVPIGAYRKVVATPDINMEFLLRSMAAGDLEESIALGLLDLTPEEAALCTYVCPAKIEFDEMLKKGLASYQKEM